MILIAFKAIELVDFSVIEGARTLQAQKELFAKGKTKTLKSYHLITEDHKFSRAFDVLPYPFNYKSDWKNRERFSLLAGILIGIAYTNGYQLTWGGDWDKTYDPTQTNFYDAVHFQIEH